MEYISAKEAAAKWGVHIRVVQQLCKSGRVAGARKYGVAWMLPADCEKPADPRRARKGDGAPLAECSIMPALYIHGGDLEGAFARCRSDDERALLEADLAQLRGDAASARALAAGLYKTTAQPQIKLGCGIVEALAAMWLGDLAAWRETVLKLSMLRLPEGLRHERELAVAALNAGLHGRGVYPKWLETGAFSGLAGELYPAARWIYTSILYIKWREVDLIAVAEPLIAECRREKSDLCEIYLRLIAATAYSDHGDAEAARSHVAEAAALALPLGFIAPFVEYRANLTGAMDMSIKTKYHTALREIKKLAPPFLANWSSLYSSVWETSFAGELTPREFEVCVLYARGMTAGEISERLDISKNSVRKYLSATYSKLGVSEKRQLARYIHT